MKKTYKSLATFIVLLSMLTINLSAQLSGVITINSGAPASSTNYQTFSALAATLNTSGVNGPLVVNVVSASGPYNEQPSFGVISGVSATNTITINGNGNVLTFSASLQTSAWTLNLNGSDYMNFNNLTVVGTNSVYATPCLLNSGADHNTFTACTFSCPLNTTVTSGQQNVLLSGSNTGLTQGISASYTTFKNCTMIGGLYNVYFGGNNNPPYATNNTLDGCILRDTYSYGLQCTYQVNLTVRNCTVDRPTRPAAYPSNGAWAMTFQYCQNAMVEGNIIEKLFDAQLNSTLYAVGIYIITTSASTGTGIYSTYRNNVIRDIKSNGHIIGFYGNSPDAYIHHNTISLDHTASTAATTFSTIGINLYGASGVLTDIRNNCISITRGGTGPKYCYHSGGNTGNITLNYNNYYMNAAGTNNYIAFYSANASNLAALQAQGVEANGMSLDPQYTALPSNLIPTSVTMNNQGTPLGTMSDINGANRSGVTPDVGAYEYLSNNCTGVPSSPSITAATQTLCFGKTANLVLNGASSDVGIVYQWLYSTTSASGPWAVIPGANSGAFTTPPTTVNIFYGIETKCTLTAATSTAAAQIDLAATTISTVPCYESFEGITKTNELPNCSWSTSGIPGTCLTFTNVGNGNRSPHTGTNFASFFWSPLGEKYFYTNGIQLNAGVTYSTGLWFQTDNTAANNWTDLSILIGTTQSTTGLVPIVSTNGPAIATVYNSLSGTFTVATSGIYYIAIKETNLVQYGGSYLTWDDFFITIPCSLNTPSVTLSSSSNIICATQSIVLTASGADNFLWNTGATTNSITEYPMNSMMYSVSGTNTLSGCSNAVTQYITVNPSPDVFAYSSPSVCLGSSVNLSALGNASTYAWSTGSSNLNISVSPSVNTTYTLSGTNSYGCVSISTVSIAVVATPTINASSSTPTACAGESQSLTATGAVTYQWIASTSGLVLSGSSVIVNPLTTTVYTITGTDLAGCSGKFTLTQTVNECLGLNQINASLSGLKIYPNPTSGEFIVELNNSSLKTIEVIDITGRLVLINNSTSELVNVNMNELSNGIYYVKVQSNNAVEVIKVVKQ